MVRISPLSQDIMILHWWQCTWQTHFAYLREISFSRVASFSQSMAKFRLPYWDKNYLFKNKNVILLSHITQFQEEENETLWIAKNKYFSIISQGHIVYVCICVKYLLTFCCMAKIIYYLEIKPWLHAVAEEFKCKPIYYMYYTQFYQFEIFAKKLLKNKGNIRKMCDIFHHNFIKKYSLLYNRWGIV